MLRPRRGGKRLEGEVQLLAKSRLLKEGGRPSVKADRLCAGSHRSEKGKEEVGFGECREPYQKFEEGGSRPRRVWPSLLPKEAPSFWSSIKSLSFLLREDRPLSQGRRRDALMPGPEEATFCFKNQRRGPSFVNGAFYLIYSEKITASEELRQPAFLFWAKMESRIHCLHIRKSMTLFRTGTRR